MHTIKKSVLSNSIGLVLGSLAMNAHANLTSSATLAFTLGTKQVVSCVYGSAPPCNMMAFQQTDIVGSYFTMDNNSNGVEASEKTPISSFNGIHIGSAQNATGSHPGPIVGVENPNIDNPWTFFGNTGMHKTTSAVLVNGGSGDNYTLAMGGWAVTWNAIPSIPLTQLGAVTVTCTTGSSCSNTSAYTLDGAYHVAGAGFTSVAYTVHLTGTVSSTTPTSPVPVPAAAWLFGSGLVGLAGIARRRKTRGVK